MDDLSDVALSATAPGAQGVSSPSLHDDASLMTDVYAFDRCELRPAERQLLIDGAPAALGARAFDLLLALVERRDRVVAKSELFDSVWPGLVVEENNLQVQVSSLRKLLGPSAIITVAGRGYRFVAPVDHVASPTASARASAAAVPTNLPSARTRFIGREAALDTCAGLLAQTRLLTLSGIGGCGKTRLAQELAQRQLPTFPDGVWFVELGPLKDPQRVAAAVATTLGVQEAAGAPLGKLVDQFKSRRSLVVLDNCEHVIDAAVDSIEMLLGQCGDLKIVTTSREALGVAGEQVYGVRSLSLPASCAFHDIQRCESVRLFVDHARLVMPEFEVTEENAAAIAEICRRLDGIALAIELAAARVRVLSVDDIRARLDDRFRLLTGGSRALPRHQTLNAAMQWSHDLLAPEEQRLFRRLAVFTGGSTLAAATAVAGERVDEYEVLEHLTALHDKSLVIVDRDSQSTPRYRMLETVRQYAEDRLQESGEGDEARAQHVDYYVALARRAAPVLKTKENATQCAMLRHEQDNILAAHAWCAHLSNGGECAVTLFGSLWRYWRFTGQEDRAFRIGSEALELAPRGIESGEAFEALYGASFVAMRTDRRREQLGFAQRALALARRLDDPSLVSRGLCVQGYALEMTGDTPGAIHSFTEARVLCMANGDRSNLSTVLTAIGEVERAQGRFDAARALYEEALALDRECGGATGVVTALCNLAAVHIAQQDAERATVVLREGVMLADSVGYVSSMECSTDVVAALASLRGEHRVAAKFRGMALMRMQETNIRHEPVDERYIDAAIARTRAALGEEAFEAALAEGRSTTFDATWAEMKAWLDAPFSASPPAPRRRSR
jgi:predicted ATPase/DNA-binding winged helix-turn-helix (wHTH) protein